MSSAFKIYQKHYVQLVRCLPMDDVIFIGELFGNDLLPSDLKANLESLPTSANKAAKFLDNIIGPALQVDSDNQLFSLLKIMEESGYETVKKLAGTVISELNHRSTTDDAIENAVQWFSEDLKERYSDMGLTRCDEENDPWLPIKIASFTTPAFIHHRQIQTKRKTKAATSARIYGDIEDIPEVTKSARLRNIEEIFESIDSKDPHVILIEGHPGIGKTTLTKELCIRWAKGELLSSDKLVLLLFLRDPAAQGITNEQQLIEYFISNGKGKLIHHYLEKKCGANVTLIIDGFDELSGELCHKSFFTRLMKRKVLKKVRVVVTSRPLASICLHDIADKRIEILGFDKSSREKFVDDVMTKDYPNELKRLRDHFQCYPNIDAVCYIPLVLNIMIFLCIQGYLPSTTTEMYTNFILHTVCHNLKKKGQMGDDERVTKMEEFSEPVCSVLKMLQKVAFEGIINDRIVFEEKDLPDRELCRNDPTCFGLLQSTKCYSPKVIGAPVLTFNFYHVQLQEYFAAKHIMSLPEGEAYDLIRRHFFIKYSIWDIDESYSLDEDGSDGKESSDSDTKSSRNEDSQNDSDYSNSNEHLDNISDDHSNYISMQLSYVWVFLFGLTKGKFTPLQRYLSTYNGSDKDEEDERSQDYSPPPSKKLCFGPNAQMLLEANTMGSQGSSVPHIQNRISPEILLDHAKILLLFECFQEAQDNQLCKDLLQMTFKGDCIDLGNQILNPHHIASLGLFLSKSKLKWDSLNLAGCHLTDEGFEDLHHYLCVEANKSTVEDLNISDNNLTEELSSLLADIIGQLQPSRVNLSCNRIQSTGLKGIFSTMSKVSTVKELHVEMIGIKINDTALDKELICNMMSSLTNLSIGNNRLCDEGAELLSEGLVNTSSLQTLHVRNSNICTKGAVALAYALSRNTSLNELYLDLNDIGDDGAVAIANILVKDNETLAVLSVEYNSIGTTGIKALEKLATSKPLCYYSEGNLLASQLVIS